MAEPSSTFTAHSDRPPTGPGSNAPSTPTVPSSNPKLAELSTMFPTIDKGVIEMVLESVGGSSDRAIESLLGMTDPNFKPDELEAARRDESQVDLDAEFARSLQMQDEEEMQDRLRRQQGGQGQGQQQPGVLPYQPRVRKARPAGYNPGAPGAPGVGGTGAGMAAQAGYAGNSNGWTGSERYDQQQQAENANWSSNNPPGMLNLEEKLGNFAEAGKQTFSSFFNRAKAKVAEIQAQAVEPKQQPTMSDWGRTGSNEGWMGGGGGGEDKYTRSPVPGATDKTWRAMAGGNRGGEQGRGLWTDPRDARSVSSRSESFSSQSTADQNARNAGTGAPRWQPSDAFDDPMPPPRAVPATTPQATGRKSPSASVGSPDKNAAGKIDMAKLGFLPKKRVDLLSTSPSAAGAGEDEDDPNPGLPSGSTSPSAHAPSAKSLFEQIPKTPPAETSPHHTLGDDEDEDELEYTRNPFDEK